MVKKSKKFGFSLAETIILVTILAVAVAASTPILSRKIINTTDAGETLTGAAHGRYEAYMKEIVTFPNSPDGNISYEKTIDEKGIGKGSNKIVVFRRLDDAEFYDVKNVAPKVDSTGVYKDTLYEQIDNAKGKTDTNGAITTVTFNGKEYPVGGKIIVENADLIYKSGCIKNTTPQNFIRAGQPGCSAKNITLPNNTYRIIEGNITKYLKTENGNKLWELKANNPGTYTSTVTSIPWERLYSGNNLTTDRPITPVGGQYIGSFNPGSKAKNVVVHAVGGGGAGGGLENPGKAKRPNDMTDAELNKLRSTLAQRFRDVIKASKPDYSDEYILANYPDNVLVKIEKNDGTMNDATNYVNIFGNNEKTHIVINAKTGRIYGKFDVREGKLRAYPNEILKYTKTIGTQSQAPVIYDMPEWLGFGSFGDKFYVSAVGCGGPGGKGGDLKIITNFYYAAEHLCCSNTNSCSFQSDHCDTRYYDCNCQTVKDEDNCTTKLLEGPKGSKDDAHSDFAVTETVCGTKTVCDTCSEPIYWSICRTRTCTYSCSLPYISNTNDTTLYGYECSHATDCPTHDINRSTADCSHNYPGGSGGNGGACATLCQKIEGEILAAYTYVKGGKSGNNKTVKITALNQEVTVNHGADGTDYHVYVGNQTGYSLGGKGGKGYMLLASENVYGETTYITPGYATFLANNPSWQTGEKITPISEPYPVTQAMLHNAPCCGNTGDSGVSGGPGFSSGNDCTNMTGVGTTTGIYNHIYVWSVPFRSNKLTFGESGEIGEYKTSKIEEVKGEITVKIGKGGNWSDVSNDPINSKTQGPNGEDTIVKMNNKTVLTAKGGKGGSPSIPTEEYELCVPSPSAPAECKMSENREAEGIKCCHKEQGTRSTRDVIENAIRMNPFENIKSITGNSTIVGIGLGRGGEGAGTRAGAEEVNNLARANQKKATIRFTNVSADMTNLKFDDLHLINRFLESLGYNAASGDDDKNYRNKGFTPSPLNFKGGDGAVIITW